MDQSSFAPGTKERTVACITSLHTTRVEENHVVGVEAGIHRESTASTCAWLEQGPEENEDATSRCDQGL